VQQPAPAFVPGGYVSYPAPAKRRPTGLLVALFSALALLTGMVAIAFFNQTNPASISTDYKNEDWEVPPVTTQPPPLVKPEDRAEITTLTKDNPLYNTSLESPVRCDLELLPGREQDDQELQTRLQTYVGCLTRVWGPTLKQAGYTAFQPKITVFPEGETIATGCGNQKSHNAFYCTLDQQIYISQDVLDVLSADVSKARIVFNLIIAHEYGHAVQGQAGILASGHMLIDDSDESEKLETSRRLETQADCFAGAALGSLWQGLKLTDADRQDILATTTDIGDDKLSERNNGDPDEAGNHGKSQNRRLWVERGLNSGGSLGQCNTFNAPASEVE
jgi:hypothetical protein